MPESLREIDASIDVADVLADLGRRYGGGVLDDYLLGKTVMRDAVRERLACSSLEAEELVDLLETGGHVRFIPDGAEAPPGRGVWRVGPESEM